MPPMHPSPEARLTARAYLTATRSKNNSLPISLRWALLALIVLAALSLGGCIPGEHLDAAPVAGQVVDRATRQPIAGATVVLSTFSPDHEAQAQTDVDGRFHFPGFRHVQWTPLPYGFFRAPTGHLHVEAAGYRTYDRSEFFDTDEGPGYSRFNASGNLVQVRVELARDGRRRSSNAH